MMYLPEHKAGLSLTHNEHRNYYQSAREAIAEWDDGYADWPPGEMEKAIATDSIWVLHWYPNTPVGFNCVAASTLEAVLDAARAVEMGEVK